MTICKQCSKEFKGRERYGYERDTDQLFCSRNCYTAFRRNQIGSRQIVTCAKCGKQFKRWPSQIGEVNYCSKSCANSANHPSNRPRRKYTPPIERICENCGKTFRIFPYRQPTARFCSKNCWYEFRTTSSPKPRDSGLRNLPNQCMICGFDIVVSVHHIIPKREGGTDALNNLIVLCPNHHAMADRNLIEREKLMSINLAAIAQQ